MSTGTNGYGSVLFFEYSRIIEYLQQKSDLYEDNFPICSEKASGMNQFVIWNALEIEGFGT